MKRDITVLYIDDEEINLFIFEKSFKQYFNVLTSESGEEGLKKIETFQKDIKVVISDMRMPGMNGIEFVKKAKSRFTNIDYYILSAFNFNKEFDNAIQEKLISKFFIKPFDIQEIKTEIDRIASLQ